MAQASASRARTSARAAGGSSPRRARATKTAGASPAERVRWDRLGRVAMLFVLGALLYLYLSAGIHMLSTWSQSRSDRATVAAMQREHTVLLRQHESLGRQGTLEAEARRLGMMRQGEQSYVITGLPNN